MNDEAVEEIRRQYRLVKDAPPIPKEVRTNDLVPYPRIYRQWLTDGSLILWANTDAISQLPRHDGGTINVLDRFVDIIHIGISIPVVPS